MIHFYPPFSCSEFYRMDVWQEVTLDYCIMLCCVVLCWLLAVILLWVNVRSFGVVPDTRTETHNIMTLCIYSLFRDRDLSICFS
jgi:hypothetical protein